MALQASSAARPNQSLDVQVKFMCKNLQFIRNHFAECLSSLRISSRALQISAGYDRLSDRGKETALMCDAVNIAACQVELRQPFKIRILLEW